MFSILIPSYNNLEYLKICVNSIQKNSTINHQIIIHINEGVDGTIEYIKKANLDYSYSNENIGMPAALNRASKLARFEHIIISHDDFYYCPGWDNEFLNELKKIDHNKYYLSGTMIGPTSKHNETYRDSSREIDAGENYKEFNENKLLDNLNNIMTYDFQGTTKHPALVHKKIWDKVGGWSEEFFPTGGDDSDFNMKLWRENVRIFKGLGKCIVYHFGSITTRKKNKSLLTYLGSKGNKIFLKKWGITINFFERFYLKSGIDKRKKPIYLKYDGPLCNPRRTFNFFLELLKCKFQLLYLLLTKFNINEK